MLLEHTLVKAFFLVTLTFMNHSRHHARIVQINPNWVVWEVLVWQLSYLSGALDVTSGICEIVVCLFFTHWLQLEVKQRTSLPSS